MGVPVRRAAADPLRESRRGVSAASASCDVSAAGANRDRVIEVPHVVAGNTERPPSPGRCEGRAHRCCCPAPPIGNPVSRRPGSSATTAPSAGRSAPACGRSCSCIWSTAAASSPCRRTRRPFADPWAPGCWSWTRRVASPTRSPRRCGRCWPSPTAGTNNLTLSQTDGGTALRRLGGQSAGARTFLRSSARSRRRFACGSRWVLGALATSLCARRSMGPEQIGRIAVGAAVERTEARRTP
jgi:hypothetical protein